MSADPSNWSDEKLIRHAYEWAELPPLPGITKTMSDADVEAHGEMLYIRGMVDDLTAAKAELHKEVREFQAAHDGQFPAEPIMCLQFLAHSAEMLSHRKFRLEPSWDEVLAPMRAVGAEIVSWREALDGQDVAA